jgi:hypothetical protein
MAIQRSLCFGSCAMHVRRYLQGWMTDVRIGSSSAGLRGGVCHYLPTPVRDRGSQLRTPPLCRRRVESALGIRNCNTAHRGARCAVSISEWLGHSKIGVHVTWFMYVLARDQTLLMAATGSSICTVNTSRLPILKRSIAHRAKLHLWLWTWIAGLRPDRSQNPPPGFSSA